MAKTKKKALLFDKMYRKKYILICRQFTYQNCAAKKSMCRSSRSQMFFKTFRRFHRKTLVWEYFFNKFADLKAYNFIKKRLQRHFLLHVRILVLHGDIQRNTDNRTNVAFY